MLILRQTYFHFCTPRSKTPQPALPYFVHVFIFLGGSLLNICAFHNINVNRNFLFTTYVLFSIVLFPFSWNQGKLIRISLIFAIWQKCVVDPRNIDNHSHELNYIFATTCFVSLGHHQAIELKFDLFSAVVRNQNKLNHHDLKSVKKKFVHSLVK
jgi:hypothetical protein